MGVQTICAAARAEVSAQHGHLFLWGPVILALGIGVYFTIKVEPGLWIYGVVAGGGVVLAALGGVLQPAGRVACWALAVLAAGFCLAGLRAHNVAGPVLAWHYYGPVEGRVIDIDRSASGALRLTLDRVILRDLPPRRTPKRVRISLHGEAMLTAAPGQTVITTGHLAPPRGPVEPGGFDFQRHAWFQSLGAVGYTRAPVLALDPVAPLAVPVLRLRMAASARVQEILPGDIGGFAAAVTSGDRSGMSQAGIDALRASNLAHLLAISGLHMGLLAGFVFGTFRLGFAMIPRLALRYPVKKWSAALALGAAAFYLALSGGNVATERAFVMAAVALGAVMLDRSVLSLRSVALAAIIVLCLRPEALLGPGFQMSFAATTALVAVFGALRRADITLGPKPLRPVVGVALTSLVAGAATAPIAAAHFNTFAHYGLIANVAAVPVMGLLVMPAAVLSACLAPFGLEAIGLWLMGAGLRWILGVAHWVSALDGARGFVPSPGTWVLPIMIFGVLFLILWQGRARYLGVVVAVCAVAFWGQSARPTVLIAESGGLVGVHTETGRALSKARGAGFAARNWLENDGEGGTDQATAAARWSGQAARIREKAVGPITLVHLMGKRAAAARDTCQEDEIVVLSTPAAFSGPCQIYDPQTLRTTGSVAIYVKDNTLRIVTARRQSGARLWNTVFPDEGPVQRGPSPSGDRPRAAIKE